jgi:ABC-type multidrug transport system fused ATPase/permease subunit
MSIMTRGVSPGLRSRLHYQRPAWVAKGVTAVIGLTATTALGRAVPAVAMEQLVDHFGQISRVVTVAGAALFLVAAVGTGSLLIERGLSRSIERRIAATRLRALRALRRLTPRQVRSHRSSLIERLTTELDGLSCYARWNGKNLPLAAAQITVSAVVMVIYSWQVTIAVFIGLIPLVAGTGLAELRLARAREHAAERDGRLIKAAREVLETAPAHRAHQARHEVTRQVREVLRARDVAAMAAVRASAALTGLREFSVGVVVAATVAAALALRLDAGHTVALVLLAVSIVPSALTVAGAAGEAHQVVERAKRLRQPLVKPQVQDPGRGGTQLPVGAVDVRFEEVTTRVVDGGALNQVSLTIPAGRMVALLGTPGSGHAAVADLVTRLTDPADGRVLLAGVPLTDVPFDSLRRRVLAVPRTGFIVDGTVADNIAFGRHTASFADVYGACAELGLTSWVDGLAHGLSTRVGREGRALSPAERQLISLARAYLNQPDVLVVNDSHGGDPVMQKRIDQALAVLARGRTTILITHRPRCAKIADQVMIFDGGRLVESGTYAALSENPNTRYARLNLGNARLALR